VKWIWKALALLLAVLFAAILIAPSVDLDDFVARSLSPALLFLLGLALLFAIRRPSGLRGAILRPAGGTFSVWLRRPSRPLLCTLQC
jgi:hypothetical protein